MTATSRRSIDRHREPRHQPTREVYDMDGVRFNRIVILSTRSNWKQKGGRSIGRYLKSKAYRNAEATREAADAATAREANIARIAALKSMGSMLPGQLTDPNFGGRGTRGRSWQFSARRKNRARWMHANTLLAAIQ